MSDVRFLTASEAATALGVSIKALRLYEKRELLNPVRTDAGWRAYGAAEMERAQEIVSLRSLGFSLAQIGRLLRGDASGLEHILGEHQRVLEGQQLETARRIERVGALRRIAGDGHVPALKELCALDARDSEPLAVFDLPWPWGSEEFRLRNVRAVNYIVGPLFSGKTRLARIIAASLPRANFVGLERLDNDGSAMHARLRADAALKERADLALAWLVDEGATASAALTALVGELESQMFDYVVVDMIEQGLDAASQEAVAAYLGVRCANGPKLFLLTRSNAILDLASVGANETILLCPANHSVPVYVPPFPGAPGYETVASCLAPPAVRARTAGVVALMQPAA